MAPGSDRLRAVAFRRRAAALRARAIEAGRRARRQLLILMPLLVCVVAAYVFRVELFGVDKPVRLATAGALIVIGWALASSLGRAFQPRIARRIEPGDAGIAGFMVRLVTLFAIVLISLRVAGVQLGALALGASFTAVIVGLAAQQTFGNVLAGVVLVSAHLFEVGDRVRFSGFGMDVEGTVAAHGLLYLTLTDGDDVVMLPNSTALTMSVRPLREPAAVDMRARLPLGVDPEVIQDRVGDGVSVATKGAPHVALEEFDSDHIVVRIRATPVDPRQGGRLAREVLDAVAALRRTGGGPVPPDPPRPGLAHVGNRVG
jgi:small conductance mechanosensitive channel